MNSATVLDARGYGLWDVILLFLVAGLCGTKFPVVWSIMGSAVFVAVIGLIARSRR